MEIHDENRSTFEGTCVDGRRTNQTGAMGASAKNLATVGPALAYCVDLRLGLEQHDCGRTSEDFAGYSVQVAKPFCRGPPGWLGGRTTSGSTADDHRDR